MKNISEEERLGSLGECGAHKLNLVATADVTLHCKDSQDFLSLHTSAFTKITCLWSLQNMSPLWAEEIKQRFKTLFAVGCETRWFSKYEAICDYLGKLDKFPNEMKEMFASHQKPARTKSKTAELPKFTLSEEHFLREYVKVTIEILFVIYANNFLINRF